LSRTDLSKSPARIAGMFDAIATRYDFLNHLLSVGVDRRWRRRAIRALSLTGRERVLDLCTGTADLAIASADARPGSARVIRTSVSFGTVLMPWLSTSNPKMKPMPAARLWNRVSV